MSGGIASCTKLHDSALLGSRKEGKLMKQREIDRFSVVIIITLMIGMSAAQYDFQ